MLNKLNKFREEREQGFTLIELLVVILIIGILAAIAVPAFIKQRKSANDAALESDLKNASASVLSYGLAQGKFGALPNELTSGTIEESTSFDSGKGQINLSSGSKIKISGDYGDEGLCVTGTNDGSNYMGENTLAYDSLLGGLIEKPDVNGACTASDLDNSEGESQGEALTGTISGKVGPDGDIPWTTMTYELKYTVPTASGVIRSSDKSINGQGRYTVYYDNGGGYGTDIEFVNGVATFTVDPGGSDASTWGYPTSSSVGINFDY